MPSRLRQTSARVSFFAFQDMITTVTGVLIIVMLLLSLEVARRKQPADPARDALQKEVEAARQQLASNLATLRQRQSDVSRLAHRIFVLPQADPSGKRPVLVVLSATNGTLAHAGETNTIAFPAARGETGFNEALASCDPAKDRLVFYVRPSGIAAFESCRQLADRRGFRDSGYDAAEEDREYILSP